MFSVVDQVSTASAGHMHFPRRVGGISGPSRKVDTEVADIKGPRQLRPGVKL